MNLKTGILILIFLLVSSQYFAGQSDRVPRIDPKDLLAFGSSLKEVNTYCLELPSYENDFNGKDACSSGIRTDSPWIHDDLDMYTVEIRISKLNPLFLDRPPPLPYLFSGFMPIV